MIGHWGGDDEHDIRTLRQSEHDIVLIYAISFWTDIGSVHIQREVEARIFL